MLSLSLTYSKPLTFAKRIPDFVNVAGVVMKASELSFQFLWPIAFSINASPALPC